MIEQRNHILTWFEQQAQTPIASIQSWERALERGDLKESDFYLIRELCSIVGQTYQQDHLLHSLILALCSNKHSGGTCLKLDPESLNKSLQSFEGKPSLAQEILGQLDLHAWDKIISNGEIAMPLVRHQGQLYFHKDYCCELRLQHNILQQIEVLNQTPKAPFSPEDLEKVLIQKQPALKLNLEQLKAVGLALNHSFSLITGGPGTGKTTIIASLINCICNQDSLKHLGLNSFSALSSTDIVLCAPTGRAAGRLLESVLEKADEPLKEHMRALKLETPLASMTLHKLLNFQTHRGTYQYNENNPLDYKLIIVDECSMIDLYLMDCLIKALDHHSRLVLIGDMNQLPSVDEGQVFCDLLSLSNPLQQSPHPCLVELLTCYRSEQHILGISNSILRQNALEAWMDLRRDIFQIQDDKSPHIPTKINLNTLQGAHLVELSANISSKRFIEIRHALLNAWLKHMWQSDERTKDLTLCLKTSFDLSNLMQHLKELNFLFEHILSMRILCATHKGIFGVEEVQNSILKKLASYKLPKSNGSDYYAGTPIMVSRNDPNKNLYNGDVGLLLPSSHDQGQAYVVFQRGESFIAWPLHTLSHYEVAFTTTIHKSQGSEYDKVLIFPGDQSKTLNRPLLYTALTRAKSLAILVIREEDFMKSVARNVERSSGLAKPI